MASRKPCDIEIGNEFADIGQVCDALFLQILADENADRHRYLVDALLALLRGDGDLLPEGGYFVIFGRCFCSLAFLDDLLVITLLRDSGKLANHQQKCGDRHDHETYLLHTPPSQ